MSAADDAPDILVAPMADAEPRAFEPPTSERSGTLSKRLTKLSETTLISPPESRRA